MGNELSEEEKELARRLAEHVLRAKEIAAVLNAADLSETSTRNVLIAVLHELLDALQLVRAWREQGRGGSIPPSTPAPRRLN